MKLILLDDSGNSRTILDDVDEFIAEMADNKDLDNICKVLVSHIVLESINIRHRGVTQP